jgi:hypothetical protein
MDYGVTDYSKIYVEAAPDSFDTVPSGRSELYDDYGQTVTPDHWHHVELSFDIDTITTEGKIADGDPDTFGTINSSAKFYLAMDDENLTGKKLSYFTNRQDNTNGVVTVLGHFAYTSNYIPSIYETTSFDTYRGYTATTTYSGTYLGPATYDFDPPGIEFDVITVPGDIVSNVQMAELQIYNNLLLDTSSVANRRFFINDKGKPVNPSKNYETLGKPTVLLHRSTNWKKGKNTGVVEVDFQPSGDNIEKYKPEPSLHGPQFPRR